jgi:hypothetical protein
MIEVETEAAGLFCRYSSASRPEWLQPVPGGKESEDGTGTGRAAAASLNTATPPSNVEIELSRYN